MEICVIKEDSALLFVFTVALLYGLYNAFIAHNYRLAAESLAIGACGLIWTRYKINRSRSAR